MVPFPDRGSPIDDRPSYDKIVSNYEKELYKIFDKFLKKLHHDTIMIKIFNKDLGVNDDSGVHKKWFAKWKEIKHPDPIYNIQDLVPVIMNHAFVPQAQHDVYPFEAVISHVKYHKDRVEFHIFTGNALRDGRHYGVYDKHQQFKIEISN